ncbi:major capsid protein [Sigmofec virus UA08Rod_5365]|uniref:Major capsid protein n=1 Tax=Sigmofec virus UA08Rod_5365 TaxID=2929422 RepID=A0A976N165_9VIRU|nr:major capsid protein [Sigmofec virus UA08Rod_5365]
MLYGRIQKRKRKMGKTVTLGGDRIGSEGKMKEYLHNYHRSSHNIGNIIATDQATGTLVPYFCDIATNGTTYYIDMATKVRTLPTNGPLFGSFKHQLDWYCAPIRLYIGALHNNALGIGLKMKEIKLPKMIVRATQDVSISKDSILAYIGISSPGTRTIANNGQRLFPAIFNLFYWDVYKNYYANKQEKEGVVISGVKTSNLQEVTVYAETNPDTPVSTAESPEFVWNKNATQEQLVGAKIQMIYGSDVDINDAREEKIYLYVGNKPILINLKQENTWSVSKTGPNSAGNVQITFTPRRRGAMPETGDIQAGKVGVETSITGEVKAIRFPLENIDAMREKILATPKSTELIIPIGSNGTEILPYSAINGLINNIPAVNYSQCGLGIKTYLSDRFNNWLSTEWIDGTGNGINEITAIDVSDGKLKVDELILGKKLFNLLNRVAISGGSYNDWQEAVYGMKTIRLAESPIYCGGMSSEIVFDEVVANSGYTDNNGDQALGTLAGRGSDRASKGGKSIKIKINEPSMIMCIGSITPRVFYSQGNKWWNQLDTMDDLHKPGLDKIGFQELITDEFAAKDTDLNGTATALGVVTPKFNSVGKQVAWQEYMTNQNESYGSFAAGGELEWMVPNRKYKFSSTGKVIDATTYIDPVLFNTPFADSKITAKNFWVQVAFDIIARRVMSARQIPNL